MLKSSKSLRMLRPQVLNLYRDTMRVIKRLQPEHQMIWYDYTRLKYKENENLFDSNKIIKLIQQAREEIDWVKTVLERKNG